MTLDARSRRYAALALALGLGLPLAHAHSSDSVQPTPGPRTFAAMVYDTARMRLVMGGGGTSSYAPFATWELGPGVSWTPGAAAPTGLYDFSGHAMAFDSRRGLTVLVGGPSSREVWELDASGWRAGVSPPQQLHYRTSHAMCFDEQRGVVVLFGGLRSSSYQNDTWEYDGTTWSPGPAAPVALGPRSGAAMAYDGARARAVLFGGRVQLTGGSTVLSADTWEYDGSAWTRGAAAPGGPAAREYASAAFDAARARLVLFGGQSGGASLGDTWEYDGTAWTAGPAAPPAMHGRSAPAMAYHAGRGAIVLYGGATESSKHSDTWEYDGVAWRLAALLQPRFQHAMAYDTARGVVVLFGGRLDDAGGLLADTWELAGAGAWTPGPAPPLALTARAGHAMAYDAGRARTVLFGGWDGTLRDDTWEYDGQAWRARPLSLAPSPRWQHAMAYDTPRSAVILFGGWDSGYRNDTWLLGSGGWAPGPAAPAGLSARAALALAHDAVRGRTVLFGGWDGQPRDDTWELSGGGWQPGATAPSDLGARYGHAMAADPVSGHVLVLGGATSGSAYPWFYDGAQWWKPHFPTFGVAGHAMAAESSGDFVMFGGFAAQGSRDYTYRIGPTATGVFGAGFGDENGNRVRVLDGDEATPVDFFAYAAGHWGVAVGTGDVDGDRLAEILTGPGPGPMFGPEVRGFESAGTSVARIDFYAYGTLRYGVKPAGGDVDGDRFAEILSAPGPGVVFGPQVRGFDYDGATLAPIGNLSFFAFATLRYGADVASGDLDADGSDEILAAPGPGPTFAPVVRGFDFGAGSVTSLPGLVLQAFATPQYGAFVAGADVTGDGRADIAATPGPGGSGAFPAEFRGFAWNGTVSLLPGFDLTLTNLPSLYGGRVALGDASGDGRADLFVGCGPDPAILSMALAFGYDGASLGWLWQANPLSAHYGLNVAAGFTGY